MMHSQERPEQPAIIFIPVSGEERRLSWRELDSRSNQVARQFASYGVNDSSTVVIGLPNCLEHYLASYAIWKLGAMVLPLRSNLPDHERDNLLELAQPELIVSNWTDLSGHHLRQEDIVDPGQFDTDALPDTVPNPGKAIASGGSTGKPKLIITPGPWAAFPELGLPILRAVGMRPYDTQLVSGPLFHNGPYSFSHFGLFDGQTLVLMERFDADRIPELIERYQINWAYFAPIMMRRIARSPAFQEYDWSSIYAILSTSASVPPDLKRIWIELLGPEKVFEIYAATEASGGALIDGLEWLNHPGSVGRPFNIEVRILDDDGQQLSAGQIGQIFTKRLNIAGPSYAYLGAPPAPETDDGFTGLGDLGWLDDDSYLYIADRRVDMIVTGGANVYPAEVESVLSNHPAIADIAVVGIADEEWGRRVHAIIQPVDPANPPDANDMDAHVRDQLMNYKAPKSYEIVDSLPRDEAGKIRRSKLVEERS